MTPAVIWGFGQLGQALATAILASQQFTLAAVVDRDAAAAARLAAALGSDHGVPLHRTIAPIAAQGPAVVFHATPSEPEEATRQVLEALEAGHSVVSAAEWLFHPWLRFPDKGAALDAASRRRGAHVLGCGINPGFCFEALPLLLSRSAYGVQSVAVTRMSDVGGIGPSDFAHLGFGLTAPAFAAGIETGAIEGHMGFPESVAVLAERLLLRIDRITDHLEPTLAERPFDLPYRRIEVGEAVGITQRATGYVGHTAVISFTLEMFLDPAGYGRVPHEAVEMTASRSFRIELKPAAPPAAGAAAMMIHAAAALAGQPPGLVSALDLPLGARCSSHLSAAGLQRSAAGVEMIVGTGANKA